ncbi:MAG: tyrosine--tRNA ligase [Patescibacteria group bacterium]
MSEVNLDLTRAVEQIYPSREALQAVLASGRKLTIYHGVDPTGPHLHLGHATNLILLRRFQEAGHKIIFLIGDFTARIGDPTGKMSARQALSADEVRQNFITFRRQAAKVISFRGPNRATVVWNSRWLGRLRAAEILELMGKVTVQQMIERDMFQARRKNGKPIWLNEFLYPLLQGYDSVALEVDVEVGGNDQTFNMLMGRDLLRAYRGREKFVITTTLLVNSKTGGKLMNKSEGGLINLDDSPEVMYGKVMALPDEVIFSIAELCTLTPTATIADWRALHPRDAKMQVARAAVTLYASVTAAAKAEAAFVATFQKGGAPTEMSEVRAAAGERLGAVLIRAGAVSSQAEWRRLVLAGAAREVAGGIITDSHLTIGRPLELKIGKHRFWRVTIT